MLWISDGPATSPLYGAVRAEHPRSGLWPLLLDGGRFEGPWDNGELFLDELDADPGAHDAAGLMAARWRDYTTAENDDMLSPQERLAVTGPFGDRWPGLATPPPAQGDPGAFADQYAAHLLAQTPATRLGLVAAESGADSLTVMGWSGPANYGSTAPFSAVLRSWEARFGARVVGLSGVATLHVSVAAPPSDTAQALAVAAEHFAFCPDNVWQGSYRNLAAYADSLIGLNGWSFWWD